MCISSSYHSATRQFGRIGRAPRDASSQRPLPIRQGTVIVSIIAALLILCPIGPVDVGAFCAAEPSVVATGNAAVIIEPSQDWAPDQADSAGWKQSEILNFPRHLLVRSLVCGEEAQPTLR